jgi:hypothetical protein
VHYYGVLGLRWQLLPVAKFNRQLPQPYPSSPKAARAFVTTSTCRLVSGDSTIATMPSRLLKNSEISQRSSA